MTAEVGFWAMLLAFIASIYAVFASIYGARGGREQFILSGRNAAIATFPLLLLACAALVYALMTEQYQIAYVWSVSDPATPTIYRFTALWGSQSGSLLFWSLLLSAFSAAVILLNWRSDHRLMPYAIVYMMLTLAFFVGLKLVWENPFERFWLLPDRAAAEQVVRSVFAPAGAVFPDQAALAEGARGLNPLLRHFGMIIHPPMLYLGFVGMVIPFAFAMSALASGDLSSNWIRVTRRWSLVAWLFLSLGLLLGGRWAYDVLGWGGYWGWDPVENAAFLPWLLGTAFIHSVMIQQKRGMLKVWNMFLVIGTFSAVMFGTFATRSGLVESVHSFARSQIGLPMFLFWSSITVVSVGLLLWRQNRGELRSEHAFVGLLSRETLFVLNNVVFVALAITIFWGSFGAPIISELFLDNQITLGIDYFMMVTPPLFAALYILMGIAPLSAWTSTSLWRLGRALVIPAALTLASVLLIALTSPSTPLSLLAYGLVLLAAYVALHETYRGAAARRRARGESWPAAVMALFGRNQRRYGGYLVHLGITVIGLGVIGSTLFQYETQQTLERGQQMAAQDYSMRFDGYTVAQAEDGRIMNIADVTVFRNGQEVAHLRPRIDDFPDMPMTIAGAHSTLENDFYVLLLGSSSGGQRVTFKVYINPLVNLVWWGGIILIIGTFIAVWPRESVVTAYTRPAESAGQRAEAPA